MWLSTENRAAASCPTIEILRIAISASALLSHSLNNLKACLRSCFWEIWPKTQHLPELPCNGTNKKLWAWKSFKIRKAQSLYRIRIQFQRRCKRMTQANSMLDQAVMSMTKQLLNQMMQQSKPSVNSLVYSSRITMRSVLKVSTTLIIIFKRDLSQISHRLKNRKQQHQHTPTSFQHLKFLIKLEEEPDRVACSISVQMVTAPLMWVQERPNRVSNNRSSPSIQMLIRSIRISRKECLTQRWLSCPSNIRTNMHFQITIPPLLLKVELVHPLQSRQSRLNWVLQKSSLWTYQVSSSEYLTKSIMKGICHPSRKLEVPNLISELASISIYVSRHYQQLWQLTLRSEYLTCSRLSLAQNAGKFRTIPLKSRWLGLVCCAPSPVKSLRLAWSKQCTQSKTISWAHLQTRSRKSSKI